MEKPTSNNLNEWIDFYYSHGITLVGMPGSSKAPITPGWQKNLLSCEEFKKSVRNGDNIGILTGKPSNNLIDLDIDDDDFKQYFELNLKNITPCRSGRTQRPDTHYWVRVPDLGEFKYKAYFNPGQKTKIFEIRGDGHQTVVEPSIHPENDKYEWHNFVEPANIPLNKLLMNTDFFYITYLLGKNYPKKTSRNNYMMAIIGTFVKYNILPDTELRKIVNKICIIGNDDERFKRLNLIKTIFIRHKEGKSLYAFEKLSSFLPQEVIKAISETLKSYIPETASTIKTPSSTPQIEQVNDAPLTAEELIILNKTEDDRIEFPYEAIQGVAGQYADLMSEYLEPPKQFFQMSFLTYLGYLLSDKLTINSELDVQPRLYTIIVGESANARKSTAIDYTRKFFQEYIGNFNVCEGINSAEGLVRLFSVNNNMIINLDELAAMVKKMSIKSSILGEIIATLYSKNNYESSYKEKTISISNSYLSLLAACTNETYINMFDSNLQELGFINRLFLVSGTSDKIIAIPKTIPVIEKRRIANDLLLIIEPIIKSDIKIKFDITNEAVNIYSNWYIKHRENEFGKRLETYGHRLSLLLAVNYGKDIIDEEIMIKTLELLNYQLKVRQELNPVISDNRFAKYEMKIRNTIKGKGIMRKRELERKVNKNKMGIFNFNTALNNLISNNEIEIRKDQDKPNIIYYKYVENQD